MYRKITRRDLTSLTPAVLLSCNIIEPLFEEDKAELWPGFPQQDARLVSEVVGKAHSDEARVKELVRAHPSLVNACWDWGFGDWETPLGAASHVGQRGIAEFLLEQGARIDIFAAAMLGYTDVVKAFVKTRPGVQRTLGPHGITLLAHAAVGGKEAEETVDYLKGLGDADIGIKVVPLPNERRDLFLGKFESRETGVVLELQLNKAGKLMAAIQKGMAPPISRALFYQGDDEFFPSGVPGVRLRFMVEGGKATALTLQGTGLSVKALRSEKNSP